MAYLKCMAHRRRLGGSCLGNQVSVGMGPFLPPFLLSLVLLHAPNLVSKAEVAET